MFNRIRFFLLVMLISLVSVAYGKTQDFITINATITATDVSLSPDTIPENAPFIIHVINKAGAPVELENTDTSVEVYAGMDKTFRVGLKAGSYRFFNDFNAHTKAATLWVKTAAELENKTIAQPVVKPHLATTAAVPAKQSSANLENSEILFIVWRESVEALLVVGIVYSWLKQAKTGRKSGFLFLWLGVAIGLLCAILLSFVLVTIGSALPGNSANYFQAAMTFTAACMIVYMVKWMRDNGRKLKAEMHTSLAKNASNKWRNISILTVVAVAIAREASEAAIFIYALGFSAEAAAPLKMLGLLALGVVLAITTIYVLQLGNKIFSWRFFFKVTEILLLLLGGGLLLNCVDLLITAGLLPALYSKVWDTSFLIADGGFFAPLLSSFIGYRATPSLMDLIFYSLYWIFIYQLLSTKRGKLNAN